MKLLVFFALLIPFSSQAGLYFDPYVGASWAQWKSSSNTGPAQFTSKGNSYGVTGGALLGFTTGVLLFGLDANYSMTQFKYNKSGDANDSNMQDVDANEMAYGPLIGLTGKQLSFWVSYSLLAEVNMNKHYDPSFSQAKYTGTGLNVGIGRRAAAGYKLSLEYRMEKYSKVNFGGSDIDLPGSSGTTRFEPLERNVFFFSLSYPFGGSK